MNTELASDKFGFLVIQEEIDFAGGMVSPVSNLAELVLEIKRMTNPDGYLYPPIQQTWREKLAFTPEGIQRSEKELVEGSRREALLFTLPTSHVISVCSPLPNEDFRDSDGAFLLYALAYLYGTRLQFEGWFFDMRIPITTNTNDFAVSSQTASAFLSSAYSTWRGWSDTTRVQFANVLYMNSRSPSYEWLWERFAIDYMVFDGLYKTAKDLRKVGDCGHRHRQRLDNMCTRFGVPANSDEFDRIYGLRNELFHETLWAGGQPGRRSEIVTFYSALYLRWMNLRLIPSMLGYKTEYIGTPWWQLGSFVL